MLVDRTQGGTCQGRMGRLLPMGSFDVYEGHANSGPGRLGVLEMTWMDGPSFSLCAVPLESSGPGFQGAGQNDRGRSGSLEYSRPEGDREDLEGKKVQDCYTLCNTASELRSSLLHDPNLFQVFWNP